MKNKTTTLAFTWDEVLDALINKHSDRFKGLEKWWISDTKAIREVFLITLSETEVKK